MEEGLTALLSNIADNAIMQDKSNFNTLVSQYMAQGMSESEAKKKAWLDSVEGIAFDTIAGAASGGVSGGFHTSMQNIAENSNIKNHGQTIIENGGVIIRVPASSINIYKRDVQGVIIMRIEEGNQLVSLERVESIAEEEAEA